MSARVWSSVWHSCSVFDDLFVLLWVHSVTKNWRLSVCNWSLVYFGLALYLYPPMVILLFCLCLL
jgi:hypothetical protein